MSVVADTGGDAFIENRTFDELRVGDSASLSHTVAQRDIDLFAAVSGDVNPAHVDPAYAATDMFHGIILHGMWGAGLISAVLGTKLPGPGTIYLGQDLRFRHPVLIGDVITATLTVRELAPEHGDVTLDCVCTNQNGKPVITGTAHARAPKDKVRRLKMSPPAVRVARHDRLRAALAPALGPAPLAAAVICPTDGRLLGVVSAAARAGYITPVLIGPGKLVRAAAASAGVDIGPFRMVEAIDARSAIIAAAALVRSGDAALLANGDPYTADFMHAVVARDAGLRMTRRISHVYIADAPDCARLLLVTDAGVNITPTLEAKAGIVQNAIDLAHQLGIATPRVAVLAALDTVHPQLRSTLDAAALAKMAERGQITGGLVDGPLAFDDAINPEAAKRNGIVSIVAGQSDILVAPDLESANMLMRQLIVLGGAEAAGIVVGARVPIVLLRRADGVETGVASFALAVLAARADGPH